MRAGERAVLRSVDLDVPAGSTLAVVGRSGSGKSTLALVAGGLWRPDAGHAELDGVDLAELHPGDRGGAVAFAFAGFIAAVGGILFVWWNQQISPGSMGLAAAINILIIAIIGGIFYLEGAWVGAFVFVLIDNYSNHTAQVGGPRA